MLDAAAAKGFQLLQLPDSSLVNILQFCASDPSSLLNAARAHSRLQQATAMALTRVSWKADCSSGPTDKPTPQQQLDSVLLYLASHAQHISSLHLEGRHDQQVCELPPGLHLEQLTVKQLMLQLQPGCAAAGVLAPCRTTTSQLHLGNCTLLDGEAGLEAALLQLPALQHLRICGVNQSKQGPLQSWESAYVGAYLPFPGSISQQWPQQQRDQLTYLELSASTLKGSSVTEHLMHLPHLQDLRLDFYSSPSMYDSDSTDASNDIVIPANMLSAQQQLTCLQLWFSYPSSDDHECRVFLPPAVLAGKTKLRHLLLTGARMQVPGSELLSQLQALTELAYLNLAGSLRHWSTPAEAFTALTASSALQHLTYPIASCPWTSGPMFFQPTNSCPTSDHSTLNTRGKKKSA